MLPIACAARYVRWLNNALAVVSVPRWCWCSSSRHLLRLRQEAPMPNARLLDGALLAPLARFAFGRRELYGLYSGVKTFSAARSTVLMIPELWPSTNDIL